MFFMSLLGKVSEDKYSFGSRMNLGIKSGNWWRIRHKMQVNIVISYSLVFLLSSTIGKAPNSIELTENSFI